MLRKTIHTLLAGGDRRSIDRSDEVAALVSANPAFFSDLVAGLWHDDPLVRMRAADAAEKVTRSKPELLNPYKKELLGLMADALEPELRWHLAAMVPRLPLTPRERQQAVHILSSYLTDRSSIVKTFALQGLADLAAIDATLRPKVLETLRQAVRSGTSAMKARSRKLLRQFEKD